MAQKALRHTDRVVVVVTDEAGSFVGVHSNTSNSDVERILYCALYAPGKQYHEKKGDTGS